MQDVIRVADEEGQPVAILPPTHEAGLQRAPNRARIAPNEADSPLRIAKFERAIAALIASDGCVRKAATALKISERSLWRWQRDKRFEEMYRDAVSASFRAATRRLRAKADKAVSALFNVIADKKAPRAAQVSAADCVLRHGENTELLENFAPRLERIEESDEPTSGF